VQIDMNVSQTENSDTRHNLRQIPPRRPGKTGAIQDVLESALFQLSIMIIIIINAITDHLSGRVF